MVTKPFHEIDWYGRQVRIATVNCSGSSNCGTLALLRKDSDGRILPKLVREFAREPIEAFDKIAMAAWSAGWGILTNIGKIDADRERLSAMMLSDACFSGGDPKTGQGGIHRGYVKVAMDAIAGKLLMVSTTAHTTPGHHLTGRQSWKLVWDTAMEESGKRAREVKPREPVPQPSGGWWKMGKSLYWGDYTQPNSKPNQGNDMGHNDHHSLAPKVWQGYLAPYLAGRLDGFPWLPLALGSLVGGAAGYAAHTLTED